MSYYFEYKLNGKTLKRHFENKADANDVKKELEALGAQHIYGPRS